MYANGKYVLCFRPGLLMALHFFKRMLHFSSLAMGLDAILPDVGEFGSYQLLFWFVLLPGVLPCGFHAYNQLFMAARPDQWCRVPELDALTNISAELAKNMR
jgi:hypothetical protein